MVSSRVSLPNTHDGEKNTSYKQGELEGATPASNEIKCPKGPPCRPLASAARTFATSCAAKVTALDMLQKKSRKTSLAVCHGREPKLVPSRVFCI